MSKHSINLKLEVIDHYLSGKDGYGLTAERFGVQKLDALIRAKQQAALALKKKRK